MFSSKNLSQVYYELESDVEKGETLKTQAPFLNIFHTHSSLSEPSGLNLPALISSRITW